MDDATWIQRCADQMARRWPSMDRPRAAWLASEVAQQPAWRGFGPEAGADAYVRSIEEQVDVEPSAFVLTFRCEGASAERCSAAVAVAQDVFRAAGMTPAAGARGWWERDGWDRAGFTDDESRSKTHIDAAMVWDRADQAATDACGGSQADQPAGGSLELSWREDGTPLAGPYED